MKKLFGTLALASGTILLASLFPQNASAACGQFSGLRTIPASWNMPLTASGQAKLIRTSLDADRDDDRDRSDGIVGYWHFKFISKGNDGIPDGTELDAGYQQWHSDGTEVLYSVGRAPNTGDVCFGVWKKVGPGKYRLNHFAAPWNEAQTALIGPANIRLNVTLDSEHNSFIGRFTIDQYDESGNHLSHAGGIVTGTRITVDTSPFSIF